MELLTMYPPQKDSPSTYIVGDLDSTETHIVVGSTEVLPQSVPFPLTLGFDKSVTETVIVIELRTDTNQLTIVRGSKPLAWIAGTKCSRVFTADDLLAVQLNIEQIAALSENSAELLDGVVQEVNAQRPMISANTSAIAAETTRAMAAEAAETTRSIGVESQLQEALATEVDRAIAKENILQTDKINRAELTCLVTDAQYTADGMMVAVTFSTYDANAQTVGEFVRYLPIVSNDTMGLMTPEAYTEIVQLRNDVATIQQQGGRFIGESFASKAELDAYVVPSTVSRGDFTYVLDDETHSDATTRYIYDGTIFQFGYVIEFDPIGIADASTPGIVLSDPGSTDGKVFVETDGSMSVIGWVKKLPSTHATDANAHIGSFLAKQDKITVTGLLKGNGSTVQAAVSGTDYATAAQGEIADSAIQGVSVNGETINPDGRKFVDIPLARNGSAGVVEPDGISLTVDENGIMHAAGGSGDVTEETDTSISGLLKGAAGKVARAISGTDYAPGYIPITALAQNTRRFTFTDYANGTCFVLTGSSEITIDYGTNGIGSHYSFIFASTNKIQFSAYTNRFVRAPSTVTFPYGRQYGVLHIVQFTSTEWLLYGDL